jgi:hypothetical protein
LVELVEDWNFCNVVHQKLGKMAKEHKQLMELYFQMGLSKCKYCMDQKQWLLLG